MVVAYDLGSNSLRLLIYDQKNQHILSKTSLVVGTSVGLYPQKYITKEAVTRILQAFEKLQQTINTVIGNSPYTIDGVATASFRIARNAKEVIDKIYQQTGVKLRIISGDDECYYTMVAVRHRLEQLNMANSFCLCDIGGASTEIIFYDNHNKQYIAKSFDIGIVTLCDQHNLQREDFNNPNIYDKLSKNLAFTHIKSFAKEYPNHQPSTFVATAGTPTILANIIHNNDYTCYDRTLINGTTLSLEQVHTLQKQLLNTSTDNMCKLVGEGREDFIFMGILIFKELYNILGYTTCITIDDGVSEGVAIDA